MRKTNIFAFLFLMVMMFSFTSAYLPHQQNTQLNFSITSNFATNCTLTTMNTPKGIANINQVDVGSGTYDFSIAGSNFSSLGSYCMNIVCTDGTDKTTGQECRDVTPNGQQLDNSISILFGFIFLMIIGFLLLSIYGLNNAVKAEWQIAYVCSTFLMLFCLFFVAWLFSSYYLWQTPILASIFWIIWLILSILFWPFIILLGGYLLKRQAEALMEKELSSQGYSPEDSHSMARNR